MMVIKRPFLRQLSWLLRLSLLCSLFWLWLAVQQQEAHAGDPSGGLGRQYAGWFLRLASP